MDSNTLLLAILLVAVLVAIGLLILLMLRRPEERIGGLLRGARGIMKHLRAVGMAQGFERRSHTLHALGHGFQFSSTHSFFSCAKGVSQRVR